MLYIVRAYEKGQSFDYEYGNIKHAEEHFAYEMTADIIEYNNGKETLIKRVVNGKEREV